MGIGRYKDGRKTCEVCGRFTHEGFLCRDHTYALKQGEIGTCDKCGSYYLVGKECRVCKESDPKLFAGELEDVDIEAASQYFRDHILYGFSDRGRARGGRRGGSLPGSVLVSSDSLTKYFIQDRWGFAIDERKLFDKLKSAVRRIFHEILEEHANHRFIEIQDVSESKRYLVVHFSRRHPFEYFRLTPVESTDRDYFAVHQCAEPLAKEIASSLQKEAGVSFTFRAVPTKTDWAVVLKRKPEEIEFHKW
ncbi:MAG: hypothetical protein ACW99U_15075 [Candidatus Thorarchaeota archaeon]